MRRWVGLCLLAQSMSCGEKDGSEEHGMETGPCLDGQCAQGLVCLSSVCVDADGGTTSASTTADGDTGTAGDTTKADTDGASTGPGGITTTGGGPLGIDLGDVPCVRHDVDTLADFAVSGDGTAVTCTLDEGPGAGKVPEGIELDAAACSTIGDVTEERIGTWAFMVTAEQSGVEVHVPFCATRMSDDGYGILVERNGQASTYDPDVVVFAPGQALDYGGSEDPRFEITDPLCSPGLCFFGYLFGVQPSPYDAGTFSLAPAALVYDAMNNPVGFEHHMSMQGPPVSAEFEGRSWVFGVDLDYCLSAEPSGCEGPDRIRADGDGRLHYAVIMRPQ